MTSSDLDLVAVGLVLFFAFVGTRRGFVISIFDLLFTLVTFVIVVRWAKVISGATLTSLGLSETSALLVAMAAIVVALDVARQAITRLIQTCLRRVRRDNDGFRYADRLLGVVPGIANGGALAVLLTWILLALPADSQISPIVGTASVGKVLAIVLATPVGDPTTGVPPRSRLVGVEDESGSRTGLPFGPGATARLDLAAADEFLAMSNLARAQSGVGRLTLDPNLSQIAGEHTLDMVHRAYFAHVSPDGMSPSDRARAASISYRVFAENIVYAPSLEAAFRSLMASPPHRQNQLSAEFNQVGIGVATVDGEVMVTEDFAD